MKDYIPHTSDEFDVTIENGEPVFKDKGGMTGYARRHGGWHKGLLYAVFFMIAMSFLVLFAMMFMPTSWSNHVKSDVLVGLCGAWLIGPILIAALYIRLRWLRWMLVCLVVSVSALYGLSRLLHAFVPVLGF